MLESYAQLLTNYSSMQDQSQELEELFHLSETNKEFEPLLESKSKVYDNICSESAKLCDYIDKSPDKERCYILFKENFDNPKGFNLPQTAQEFLDYILDYGILISEMVVQATERALHDTFPTLTGTNFELEEEFEITMDMLKDNSDELDGIHARWKNRVGTIRFTIDGDVSIPVHSSKEVGEYMWALIKGYKGYMGLRHEEIFSALEKGKVVVCRLWSEHMGIIDIDETLYRHNTD